MRTAAGFAMLAVISFFSGDANATNCADHAPPPNPASIRIPVGTGFSFPTDQNLLQQFSKTKDIQKIRQHAWAVFAGITQPAVQGDPCTPVWDTWFSRITPIADTGGKLLPIRLDISLESVDAFLANQPRPAKGRPINEMLKNESTFVDVVVGALRGSGEQKLYNSTAHGFISDNQLYDPRAIERQLQAVSGHSVADRSIQSFPRESIILKAEWKTVAPGATTDLRYWDIDEKQLGCSSGCYKTVSVRLAAKDEKCNLPLSGKEDAVSSCFYTVSDDNQPGNYLILVGLHVITKEMPDWTWSTFWWSPKASRKSKFSAGRFNEPHITGVWRNYVMDTTLSMTTPAERKAARGKIPEESDACGQSWRRRSTAKVVFNPYIEAPPEAEGPMVNGPLSNCMNCHKRSTFPGFPSNDMRGTPWRGELPSTAGCFREQIRLDYIWSLSPIAPDSRLAIFYNKVVQQLDTFEMPSRYQFR
jgi:hypothetical protein